MTGAFNDWHLFTGGGMGYGMFACIGGRPPANPTSDSRGQGCGGGSGDAGPKRGWAEDLYASMNNGDSSGFDGGKAEADEYVGEIGQGLLDTGKILARTGAEWVVGGWIGKGVSRLVGVAAGAVRGALGSLAAKAANSGGKVVWPPNRGFLRPPDSVVIQPGSLIDRIGGTGGTFVAPKGTPFPSRSLPAEMACKKPTVYEVLRPIRADAGVTSPWFNQPGMGVQFELSQSVRSLIESGHLKIIIP